MSKIDKSLLKTIYLLGLDRAFSVVYGVVSRGKFGGESEETGMTKQDTKSREKIENKQLKSRGLLKVIEEQVPQSEEAKAMQEHHNANHALWYLSFGLYTLLEGNNQWYDVRKVERLIAHLGHLREFLDDEDYAKKAAVNKLFWSLETEFPSTSRSWRDFFIQYWQLVRFFAQCYDQHEKCFPIVYVERLKDLQTLHYLHRGWWWRSRVRFFLKKLNRVLRNSCHRLCVILRERPIPQEGSLP